MQRASILSRIEALSGARRRIGLPLLRTACRRPPRRGLSLFHLPMPTFRRPKDFEHPYARICNDMLEASDLSFKAKGLLSYLLSRSDEWEVYQAQLQEIGPDGETAVRSGLEELEEAGYLVKRKKRDDEGQFQGWEYVIYENPTETGKPETGKPETGKPDLGESDFGKSRPTNNGNKPTTDNTNNGKTSDDVVERTRPREGSAENDSPTESGLSTDFEWVPDNMSSEAEHMRQAIRPIMEADDKWTEVERTAKRLLSGTGGRMKVPPQRISRQVKEHGLVPCIAAWVMAETKENPYRYSQALLDNRFHEQDEQSTASDFDEKLEALWEKVRSA